MNIINFNQHLKNKAKWVAAVLTLLAVIGAPFKFLGSFLTDYEEQGRKINILQSELLDVKKRLANIENNINILDVRVGFVSEKTAEIQQRVKMKSPIQTVIIYRSKEDIE